MKTCLWVDDERSVPDNTEEREWMEAKTFHHAIMLLEFCNFDEVALDHDLGPASVYGNTELNGYHIVKWLVQRKMDGLYVPPVIKVHTANPVGRDNMQAMIDRYLS